jgi:hypothetical protein
MSTRKAKGKRPRETTQDSDPVPGMFVCDAGLSEREQCRQLRKYIMKTFRKHVDDMPDNMGLLMRMLTLAANASRDVAARVRAEGHLDILAGQIVTQS